ncbi:MAG: hypothetical protein F4057_02155 [Acidobacteria bacterium]|nr:hypothetical protein [Acidobacteriota bacterium]
MTEAEIVELFTYHPPDAERIRAHDLVRDVMRDAVLELAPHLPASRERSTFITLMQQASMMANAALAIHGVPKG